jgi:hypothetical protein
MIIAGRTVAMRVVALVVGLIALVLVVGLVTRSCDKRRSMAAQERVEDAQAKAASKSAKDAIDTVAASGEATAASEELTRSNERDIRAAPGANDRVNSGVDAAGRRALCQRDAYKNTEKCKAFLFIPLTHPSHLL